MQSSTFKDIARKKLNVGEVLLERFLSDLRPEAALYSRVEWNCRRGDWEEGGGQIIKSPSGSPQLQHHKVQIPHFTHRSL